MDLPLPSWWYNNYSYVKFSPDPFSTFDVYLFNKHQKYWTDRAKILHSCSSRLGISVLSHKSVPMRSKCLFRRVQRGGQKLVQNKYDYENFLNLLQCYIDLLHRSLISLTVFWDIITYFFVDISYLHLNVNYVVNTFIRYRCNRVICRRCLW